MNKYFNVKGECLKKMYDCFIDDEEYVLFYKEMHAMMEEVSYINQTAFRNREDTDFVTLKTIHQVFLITVFYKENIELFRSLLSSLDYKTSDSPFIDEDKK